MSAARIAVIGEAYSQNLGDQLIRECLRHVLKKAVPEAEITSVDWMGRTEPGASAPPVSGAAAPTRGMPARLGAALPRAIRWRAFSAARRMGLIGSNWRAVAGIIGRADLVVIGGGELIQNNDWMFPERIGAVAAAARAAGKKLVFLACGVTPRIGPVARFLMNGALEQAEAISVRDSISRENILAWVRRVPQERVVLTADPAILLNELYPGARQGGRGSIGLNVMACSPRSAMGAGGRGADRAIECYVEIARLACRELGRPISIFTNGTPGDQEVAAKVLAGIREAAGPVEAVLLPRPETVREFTNNIASLGMVIATRLHSSIAASAFSIPCVGLVPSGKIRAFYRDTGREGLVNEIGATPPGKIIESLGWAAENPSHPPIAEYRARALANGTLAAAILGKPSCGVNGRA